MKLIALRSVLTGLCVATVFSLGSNAHAADYAMTSLEWSPYTNEKLPAKGASSAVVTEAIKASGNNLKIEFYPWSRAVNMAKTDAAYVAYFPEYHSKANEADFLYSDPIGVGPLVFVERKLAPVPWTSYDSLKGKKKLALSETMSTPTSLMPKLPARFCRLMKPLMMSKIS